jgi:hypothetical protein
MVNENLIQTHGETSAQLFGELRSLLQRPPSEATWLELCELLERAWLDHPEAVENTLLPYAAQALSRWPDALRKMPGNWQHYLTTKSSYPPSLLLRTVRLRPMDQAPWRRLLSWLDTASITSLDVSLAKLGPLQIARLELLSMLRGFYLVR